MAVTKHVTQHNVTPAHTVFRIQARIVGGGCLKHTHKNSSLLRLQVLGSDAEIGFASSLDAIGIRAEVDGIGIHRKNLLFREVPLQLERRYPLLALHDEHLQPRHLAQQSCGILIAHAEEVLGQLLSNSRCSTSIMMHDIVLRCSKEGRYVDTIMLVETLVLSVDESFPENGIHILVFHWRTILTKELTKHQTICTVDFGCLWRTRALDGVHAGRLAEQSEKIDIDRPKIKDDKKDDGAYRRQYLDIPRTALEQMDVPRACLCDAMPYSQQHLLCNLPIARIFPFFFSHL